MNEVAMTFICPAAEHDITKYSMQKRYAVRETPALYSAATVPFIDAIPEKQCSWVKNCVVDRTKEQDKLLYEDDGCMMFPDTKWDLKDLETLHTLAIFKDPSVRSVGAGSARAAPPAAQAAARWVSRRAPHALRRLSRLAARLHALSPVLLVGARALLRAHVPRDGLDHLGGQSHTSRRYHRQSGARCKLLRDGLPELRRGRPRAALQAPARGGRHPRRSGGANGLEAFRSFRF